MTAPPQDNDAPPKPIRPRGRAPEVHFCRECGAPFWPRRFDQEFCGETHRRAWHRRKEARSAGGSEMTVDERLRYLGLLGLLAESSVYVPEDIREQIENAFEDACSDGRLKWRRFLNRLEIDAVDNAAGC